MAEWRHNDDDHQWEFGYYDLPRDKWISLRGIVTDEAIERLANPAAVALRMYRSCGSLPPPWAKYLPEEPVSVVFDVAPGDPLHDLIKRPFPGAMSLEPRKDD